MSHRVRKFGTKKVLDKNLKMFECEAKTLNKRRSFHFSPHQIKFSSSWICSRLLFLLLLFFNKKRLNERFVYQLSQPIPSPPCLAPSARLPSMCYVWVSWMENRNGRLQRCPSLDQSLLTWLWQPPFASNVSEDLSAFHPPLAPPPPAYRYGGSGCWGFGL